MACQSSIYDILKVNVYAFFKNISWRILFLANLDFLTYSIRGNRMAAFIAMPKILQMER